jgi:hypothetical protein
MSRSNLPPLFVSLLAAFLLSGLPLTCASGQVPIREIEGVPHVLNPDRPVGTGLSVTFQEELRIGLAEGPDELVFPGILGLAADREGRIYVLVEREDIVRVFESTGAYRQTIGRRGEGPGEILTALAAGLALDDDGRLWVTNFGRQRLSLFDRSGQHLQDVTFRLMCPSFVQPDASGFLGISMVPQPVDPPGQLRIQYLLRHFSPDGSPGSTVFTTAFVVDARLMRLGEVHRAHVPVYARDDRGRIWQSSPRTDAYEIDVYRPDGARERVVTKAFTPLAKTDEEIAAERRMLQRQLAAQGLDGQLSLEPDAFRPAITYLFWDPRGYIWAKVHRTGPEDGFAFDLFDREGVYRQSVRIPGMVSPAWLCFQGDSLYAAETDASACPCVVRFRVLIREVP